MNFHMVAKRRELSKLFGAERAREWFFACVNFNVVSQCGTLAELSLTNAAFERLLAY